MRSPTYQLADYLLRRKGGVGQFIADRRATGRSWRLISRELYVATRGQIDVTDETVRGWGKRDGRGAAA